MIKDRKVEEILREIKEDGKYVSSLNVKKTDNTPVITQTIFKAKKRKIENVVKTNLSLFADNFYLRSAMHDFIYKKDKKENLGYTEFSTSDYVFPVKVLNQVKRIVPVINKSLENPKKQLFLVVKTDALGLGRRSICHYIANQTKIHHCYNGDELKPSDLSKLSLPCVVFFKNMNIAKEKIALLEESRIIIALLSGKEISNGLFGPMVVDSSIQALELVKDKPSFLINMKKKDYEDRVVSQNLINYWANKTNFDNSDGDIEIKDFIKNEIELTPKNISKTFIATMNRSSILEINSNRELVLETLKEEKELKETASNDCFVQEPVITFNDLVYNSKIEEEISNIRFRANELENDRPQFIQKIRKQNRLVVLLHGASGTGKSASAEALANELGKQLWTIDLGKLNDKFAGETEKKMTAIFEKAQASGAVLRLDEGDAFISNRTHGHHMNFEVKQINHLLNLIENYSGILIITSNLIHSIDPAFDRRIDLIVKFNNPTLGEMVEVLKKFLTLDAPIASDFKFEDCVKGLNGVSAGHIRNAVERAYYSVKRAGKALIEPNDIKKEIEYIMNNKAGSEPKVKIGLSA